MTLLARLQFIAGIWDMMRQMTHSPALTCAEAVAEYDLFANEQDAKRDAEWREHCDMNWPRLPMDLQFVLNRICQ